MDSSLKSGLTLTGLAVVIAIGMLALTLQGNVYMLLADVVFGFIACGLLLLGIQEFQDRLNN